MNCCAGIHVFGCAKIGRATTETLLGHNCGSGFSSATNGSFRLIFVVLHVIQFFAACYLHSTLLRLVKNACSKCALGESALEQLFLVVAS